MPEASLIIPCMRIISLNQKAVSTMVTRAERLSGANTQALLLNTSEDSKTAFWPDDSDQRCADIDCSLRSVT